MGVRIFCIPLILGLAILGLDYSAVLQGIAAEVVFRATFTGWSVARPILDSERDSLPAELRSADEGRWNTWRQKEDRAIRARLRQGDLDSMINLLLYGTSFTRQPRISMATLSEASKNGVVQARVNDLAAGLRDPADNERLIFVRTLLRDEDVDPDDPGPAGAFLYKNLLRVLKERQALAQRAGAARPESALDRASLFRDRGVSLDTGILPDFAIEQTLRDLKRRGILREGQVERVAVIGPGLDFSDKNEESAFDYYPQQTLQPFALYDSLARLGLARNDRVDVTVLDISPRVISHLQRARAAAGKGASYVVQLPHDVARPWPPDLNQYWRELGDRVGTTAAPIQPPRIFPDLQTKAVRVRPDVVLACDPVDLNIVLARLELPAANRFDLIIGTNIFVYYDAFEQALALENSGAMLKPGGLLLTNDRLPETPGGSMHQAGTTDVRYDATAHEVVGWYQKR